MNMKKMIGYAIALVIVVLCYRTFFVSDEVVEPTAIEHTETK